MIRLGETVLAGHPDKFCDQVADAIVGAAMAVDPDAYVQVEVATWSDQVWLSGTLATREPLEIPLAQIVLRTGRAIGYDRDNWIDARRYRVHDTVCRHRVDPRQWSARVNDQSVVTGWAGYDGRTAYLPPEHYLAQRLRGALVQACRGGELAGHGPDGKLLVVVKEQSDGWELEQLLVTLQQRPGVAFTTFCLAVEQTLYRAWEVLREADPRWATPWEAVRLQVNPNGPFVQGGSDGDNGQTGRKLVMDYYGPRVPIGGGALSGKHLTHIDRIGAYAAREAAVRAVRSGAGECLVRVAYAPNREEPLEVAYEMIGRGSREGRDFFAHPAMVERYRDCRITGEIGQGNHFLDDGLPWNRTGDPVEKEHEGMAGAASGSDLAL